MFHTECSPTIKRSRNLLPTRANHLFETGMREDIEHIIYDRIQHHVTDDRRLQNVVHNRRAFANVTSHTRAELTCPAVLFLQVIRTTVSYTHLTLPTIYSV